jgi:hypothetical protein
MKRIQLLRGRRGSQVVEFAILLPVFLLVYFGIIEYSWYFYQSAGVSEAAMLGCRDGSMSSVNGYVTGTAESSIMGYLKSTGVDCSGYYGGNCDVEVRLVSWPPEGLRCSIDIEYQPITGYLPFVPDSLAATGHGFFEVQ